MVVTRHYSSIAQKHRDLGQEGKLFLSLCQVLPHFMIFLLHVNIDYNYFKTNKRILNEMKILKAF